MKKKCSQCKEVKPFEHFGKNKQGRHGLRADCKNCAKEHRRKPEVYSRSMFIYMHQRCRNNPRYSDYAPNFTWSEFQDWLATSSYAALYQEWRGRGYPRSHSPTLDRINNQAGYTLDNMQVITFRDNLTKDNPDAKLTPDAVRQIRATAGTRTQRELAKEFHVSRYTIHKILHGKAWNSI